MRKLRHLLVVGVVWMAKVSAQCQIAEVSTADSLGHPSPISLNSGYSREVHGPLFDFEKDSEQTQWKLAPLTAYHSDSATDFTEFDFLYPFLTYDRFGMDRRFQFLQLFSVAGTGSIEGETRNRLTLFPIYFQQRSSNPAVNYTAVLPVYGHVRNRLFRDDIRFLAFPLYLRSAKKDVVTENFLFPFFHLRHGNQLRGWHLWPVAGSEKKAVTRGTNSLDEIEVIGGHEKFFFLWPFYFDNTLGIGTDNPQRQRLVLPFFSRQTSPLRDSSTYLWPFGLTLTEDREKKYREWGAPWPFVTFARGEGKTANRVWPFFGQARNSVLESDFYLWPLYKYNRATSEPLDRERTRILFFLYSDLIEKNTLAGTALRRRDFWPLFTARRGHDGNQYLQCLSVIEPLLPNNKSVERNFSPLWSIWRSETDARTGTKRQAALWNLYRREVTATSKKCSLLFGLFQYQSDPQGKRWRLFYLPVSHTPKTPPTHSTL